MWNLKKNDTNELIHKTEIDEQTQKTNLWLPKGKVGGGINKEFGMKTYTIIYIKQINNKDLLYSTGNYTQYLVIIYKGKESGKEYIHIYIKLNQFCTLETNTTL